MELLNISLRFLFSHIIYGLFSNYCDCKHLVSLLFNLMIFPIASKESFETLCVKARRVYKAGTNEKHWEIYVKQTISIMGNNNVIVTGKVNFAVATDSKNLWKDSWSYKHVRFGHTWSFFLLVEEEVRVCFWNCGMEMVIYMRTF